MYSAITGIAKDEVSTTKPSLAHNLGIDGRHVTSKPPPWAAVQAASKDRYGQRSIEETATFDVTWLGLNLTHPK
ncbi:hypothetical protein J6590_016846 [Homalodisca vitripennis]|nr:hypothetical protein J6590_016846 [Homalodisca vitripennis]